ncbi:MAG: hypothetical protein LBT44_00995 [Clostridiales bacterium]|jgi:pimeloyl-ACP methyl ester carboxylesterase|nr:hypothetical protein [Clostridiales bacterium]
MRNAKKLAAFLISAVAVILLLMSNTFAWNNFAKTTSHFTGYGDSTNDDSINKSGTLHHDSDGANMDVYLENWGNESIYVRLRLTEYMELGEGAGQYNADGEDDGSRSPSEANKAASLIEGASVYDVKSWTVCIPEEEELSLFEMEAAFPETAAADPAFDNHAALRYYWTWKMGGWKYYAPASESDRRIIVRDPTVYSADSPGVSETLDALVLSMRQWEELGRPIGPYWIIDADGWAYWAAPLERQTATGLLLSAVERTDQEITADYYYGVHIWAQTASKDGGTNYNDFGNPENGGWTDSGHALVDRIAGVESAELAEDGDVSAAGLFTSSPPKAIYVVPGFMASRLYSQKFFGMEIWAGLGYLTDIGLDALGLKPEMANNPNGTGMSANADRSRDKNGTLAAHLTQIESIKAALKANHLQNTYNVEFFAYNWLGDLNETAKQLEADINAKRYSKVILICHSNGGLLASTYIARSAANKNKVEKAVLLASPLWGTYTALEPIETGAATLFDSTLTMGLLQVGYDAFIKPISRHWVKSWAQNSPNTYQLQAGNEYLARFPLVYHSASGTQYITSPAEYYSLLQKSPNVNPSLAAGSARSLRYLRETVFQGDVLKLWEGVNVTLAGCEYGHLTPVSAVYHQSGSKAIFDGVIYTKEGDGFIFGPSMKGDGRFPFVNIPSATHIKILYDPRALAIVNNVILNKPVGSYPTANSVVRSSSDLPSVGMSDMLRIELKSGDPLQPTFGNSGVKVKVYNSVGKVIAQSNSAAQKGFADNNFVYSSWETDENKTNILCYIPKSGYKLEVLTGRTPRSASNITVYVETLDPSGEIVSHTGYKAAGANSSGSVLTLDGTRTNAAVPTAQSGVKLTRLSS